MSKLGSISFIPSVRVGVCFVLWTHVQKNKAALESGLFLSELKSIGTSEEYAPPFTCSPLRTTFYLDV